MDLNIPSIEDLFDPKPLRPPHPKIAFAEKQLSETGLIALEIANRDCARQLANHCLFRLPITDREINTYAKQYHLSFVDAQWELRGLRNDT